MATDGDGGPRPRRAGPPRCWPSAWLRSPSGSGTCCPRRTRRARHQRRHLLQRSADLLAEGRATSTLARPSGPATASCYARPPPSGVARLFLGRRPALGVDAELGHRLVGAVVGGVVVVLVGSSAWRVAGPAAGLVAAALAAVHPTLVAADGSLMAETLAGALVVLVVLLGLRVLDRPSPTGARRCSERRSAPGHWCGARSLAMARVRRGCPWLPSLPARGTCCGPGGPAGRARRARRRRRGRRRRGPCATHALRRGRAASRPTMPPCSPARTATQTYRGSGAAPGTSAASAPSRARRSRTRPCGARTGSATCASTGTSCPPWCSPAWHGPGRPRRAHTRGRGPPPRHPDVRQRRAGWYCSHRARCRRCRPRATPVHRRARPAPRPGRRRPRRHGRGLRHVPVPAPHGARCGGAGSRRGRGDPRRTPCCWRPRRRCARLTDVPSFRTGTVTELLQERPGLQRALVDGERAYVLTDLVGTVAVGDRVVHEHHRRRPRPRHRRLARRPLEPRAATPRPARPRPHHEGAVHVAADRHAVPPRRTTTSRRTSTARPSWSARCTARCRSSPPPTCATTPMPGSST